MADRKQMADDVGKLNEQLADAENNEDEEEAVLVRRKLQKHQQRVQEFRAAGGTYKQRWTAFVKAKNRQATAQKLSILSKRKGNRSD